MLLERDKVYLEYVKFFKRTVIVNPRNSDGQLNGEVLAYINGKIDISSNYVNGVRDGLTTEYHKNGRIKSLSYFKNGRRTSEEIGYYEDGKINYRSMWKDDKKYGSAYHYSDDNKLVNYVGLDIVNLFFYMEYDSRGNTVKAYGPCFSSNIFSYNTKGDSTVVLNNNQSYQNINDLNITVATPPNLIPQINLSINNISVSNLKINHNTIEIKNAFLHPGIYIIKVDGELMNKMGRVIKADTITLTIKRR